MIILDTNVISEAMRPSPNPQVLAWLDRQNPQLLYICSPVLGELLLGLEALPEGLRKTGLRKVFDAVRSKVPNPVLPFEEKSAEIYASSVIGAQRRGYQIAVSDGQIAAIAIQRGYVVATRDTEPFLATGLEVINPWTHS